MAIEPQFISNGQIGFGTVTTANSAIDGTTGAVSTILTASNNGTRIDAIELKAQQAVTASIIRLYITDGSNTYLWKEYVIPATGQDGSTTTYTRFDRLNTSPAADNSLILPDSTWQIKASTTNTETVAIIVWGGTLNETGDYGVLYVTGNSGGTPQSISTSYVLINQLVTEGISNNTTLDTSTTFDITITNPGNYHCVCDISFSGTASTTFDVAVHKNGTIDNSGHFQRKLGTGGDVGSASFNTLLTGAAGDSFDIRVKADGATKNFLIHEGSFYMVKI